jgi:hypothetical protein
MDEGRFTGICTTLDEQAMWHRRHGHLDSLWCLVTVMLLSGQVERISKVVSCWLLCLLHCIYSPLSHCMVTPNQWDSRHMRCQSSFSIVSRASTVKSYCSILLFSSLDLNTMTSRYATDHPKN